MSELLVEQYVRLLDGLPSGNAWPALVESGFLDLLRAGEGEEAPGLEALFGLAFETGRRPLAPPIVETMIARTRRPDAIDVADIEPILGRPIAAATAAVLMAGAIAEIQAMTVDYAMLRKQFGREIGRFQAIQQQIAVMAEEAAAARMSAQLAFVGPVDTLSPVRAGTAKLRCAQAARSVSAIAHAVHGAIGMSEEHRLHHFTRRLRHLAAAHGGESWWAAKLGDHVLAADLDLTSLVRTI